MAETALDLARAAWAAAPEDAAARLALFGAFADAEVVVLLAEEPAGADVRPATVEVDGVPHVLVFDGEERLADHARGPAPSATLPGRALAALLAGQAVGVVLDPGEAALVLSPDELDWLARTLREAPEPARGRPLSVAAPEADAAAVAALGRRLAQAGGLAEAAWLVAAEWAGGGRGPLLVVAGAAPGAERPLAAAAGEAMAFAGAEGLDVAFVAPGDPIVAEVAAVGLRLEMAAPQPPAAPAAPGSDPDKPPRLR